MDLQQTLDSIYGPLPKSYCLYFKILAIFSFVMLVITLVGFLLHVFTGKSFTSYGASTYLGITFSIALGYFVSYITSRLLNTMCIKSLNA